MKKANYKLAGCLIVSNLFIIWLLTNSKSESPAKLMSFIVGIVSALCFIIFNKTLMKVKHKAY